MQILQFLGIVGAHLKTAITKDRQYYQKTEFVFVILYV